MIRSHHRALAGLDRDLGGTLRVVWYVDYSTSSLKADRPVCSSMAACPILYAVVCVFNIFNIDGRWICTQLRYHGKESSKQTDTRGRKFKRVLRTFSQCMR